MQWYRAYIGMASDPKFRVVARLSDSIPCEVLGVWVCVLEHACGHEGSVQKLDMNDIAFSLDIEIGKVQRILQCFYEKGMIAENKVSSWDRRQFISDNVTKRVQAFRKRRGNVSETDHTIPEHISKKEAIKEKLNGVGGALRARGASRVDYGDPVNRYAFACKKIATGLAERMGAVEAQTVILAADSGDAAALEICRAEARKQRVTYKKPSVTQLRKVSA